MILQKSIEKLDKKPVLPDISQVYSQKMFQIQ